MGTDTIFAPATARGRAGVAVIRISGPGAHAAVARLCGDVPAERRAALRRIRVGEDVLDEALVLVFAAGRSFTGEQAAELQLHGSPAVVSAVLAALGGLEGLRLAEPGEFTRRALEHGRMDLTEVEALADLLSAETEAQRRQAQRVLSGAVGRQVADWRRRLVRAASLLEASIDFADEDVPVDVTPEVSALIAGLRAEFRREAAGVAAAERVRDGFEIAVLGSPNVGKSTLINTLAGRDVALTSAVPGTTRDVLEVRLDLAGMAVTVLDTAGLRDTEDEVERMGVGRARDRAEAADLRVFLVEPGEGPSELWRDGDLVLRAKADRHGGGAESVSGLTGEGVDRLLARIAAILGQRSAHAGTLTRARHRLAVQRGAAALEQAEAALHAGAGAELAAEDLRTALRSLDALVGRVDVEHILDEVFATFCIGK